jgi:hypothetical protein
LGYDDNYVLDWVTSTRAIRRPRWDIAGRPTAAEMKRREDAIVTYFFYFVLFLFIMFSCCYYFGQRKFDD